MFDDLIKQILDSKPERVMIQAPAGLASLSLEIAASLEEKGIEAIISCDPCYGSCGLADDEAALTGSELLVHIGHNKFYKDFPVSVPVIYYPYEIHVDLNKVDFSAIKEKKIALYASVQYLHLLDKIADKLKEDGKDACIAGQILGCCYAEGKNVDASLVVASGQFHPLALKGKIYLLDTEKMKVDESTGILEKKKYAAIYKLKEAKTVGIILSSKKGQLSLERAFQAKREMTKKGKKVFMLIMDNITDNSLPRGIDAFINTACPRIIDDNFSKPIVNYEDVGNGSEVA